MNNLFSRIDILGVPFDNVTKTEAVEYAYKIQSEHKAYYVVTPNPEIVMRAREDEEMLSAVKDAELVIPDGIGVIYGAKFLGTPMKERVPGIDFTTALMEKMNEEGRSVFLFGSKPGVADKAAENLSARYPRIRFVGTNDGYFTDDEPIIEKINSAKPDLMLVCLGAPKQEKWMQKNAHRLDVGLMIGAGGSLDVFAGIVERAPEKWQKLGLEWLYRLKKEPKRIIRMMNLPKFMIVVIFSKIRG
ncbi:MAG: WecB/TagA/CpsF family glycosyltransferase [Oscillospiraceae bacterium]|nr:WecB/TagA/CpsF family glycosyltransferase [Oscillospiraceae bacterium]